LCCHYLETLWKNHSLKKTKYTCKVEMDLSGLLTTAHLAQGTATLNSASVLHVATAIAEKVNKIVGLTDKQKIDLSCKVLKSFLQEEESKQLADTASDSVKQAVVTALFADLFKLVDEVVPTSLELIFSAANGKISLTQAKQTLWAGFVGCFFSPGSVIASDVTVSQLVGAVENRAVAFAEKKASVIAAVAVEEVKSVVSGEPMKTEELLKEVAAAVVSEEKEPQADLSSPVSVASAPPEDAVTAPAPSPVGVSLLDAQEPPVTH
jgi:hypothetical protein